ncbi:helix-turn-helix transcriptional regulator [Sulfitobacter sp. BSw21498]|uniref:helix-turn-helix transcriptional regulator n=1 Tax=Sulfitobacter sp. BSw21498 TaxID=664426 RepID=UPI001110B336|nr:AlpA family transcriptional regulator [Sulfitobacter sp. BSw21498]
MNALTNSTAIPAELPKFSPAALVPNALLRTPDVCAVTGMARPTLYEAMQRGIFPRPIKLGEKSSAWGAAEVNMWCAYRLAGKTENQLKDLVVQLTEARKHCA